MAYYNDLIKDINKVSPNTLSNVDQSKNIYNLDVKYYKGTKLLTFFGEVSSSSGPKHYPVMVSFKRVEPTSNLTDEEIQQGFLPKPSLSENEIAVRCGCPSYRFRFEYANRKNKASTGSKFPKYIPKTDRKPNNPDQYLGLCKHLIEFISYLTENGFIVD